MHIIKYIFIKWQYNEKVGGVINEGIAISYTVIKMNAFDL